MINSELKERLGAKVANVTVGVFRAEIGRLGLRSFVLRYQAYTIRGTKFALAFVVLRTNRARIPASNF